MGELINFQAYLDRKETGGELTAEKRASLRQKIADLAIEISLLESEKARLEMILDEPRQEL